MNRDDDKTRTHVVLTKDTMVGHYRIVEKIGAGGMGEVYLADDTDLDRTVALKFLPHQMCADEDCRARFKREAQAAAKLNHPNIITIHEVSEYNGRPYFAMEHVEGRPLKNVIEEDDISIESAIEIISQLCDGLAKAHRGGITHRDIKPSNIVMDADGRARLLDFGLATIQYDEKLTKTGSTLGTIGYMSPEQIKAKPTDQRSDLFSLGVVLYEMITGHKPFEKDNEAATLNAILNDTPDPMTRYKSDVPEELQRIVSKLLEKDPAFRYQNAEGISPDLKALVSEKASAPAKPTDWWNRYVVVGAVAILVVIAGYWIISDILGGPAEPEGAKRKMLAVLPFENLGLPEDEYFADGITDEITSRLAMVHGLGVISRTSAYAYKNSDKTLPEIAKELGVDYILEGTIRWDKSGEVDKIRVTPQLIFVKDDTHIWADNYERNLNEIFAVQADIAIRIVDTLGVTLLATERTLIEDRPTDNLEAYNLYLRAKEYWDRNKIEPAISLVEQAIEADSTFAKAYSLLARLHGFSYYNAYDHTEHRLENCEKAARNAVRFSNGGIEGNIAMGYYYYYGKSDYNRALKEFEWVLDQQPSNSDVQAAIAFVQRRQGKWQEAADNLRRAVNIDPHSQGLATNLIITLQCMGEHKEIIRVADKGLSLSPDAAELLFFKANAVLESSGDTTMVREILDQAARYGEPDLVAFWMEGFDVTFRDYESAVNRRKVPGNFFMADSAIFYLNKASFYYYLDRDSLSVLYFDSARLVSEKRMEVDSNSAFNHLNLGNAYAGLGRSADAIREGKRAVELLPISQDALYGPAMIEVLARIYIMAGEYDLAIDQLVTLMSVPSGMGLYDLHHHPDWDPIRDHPRFQALLKRYDNP